MKYTIENERLMMVMKNYMDRFIPDIGLPLKTHKLTGKGNSGYGSGLHDYTYLNIEYYNERTGETLFTEYDSRYNYSDHKWTVSEILQPIYDFFGEEQFEQFVKWYFKLDISNKGNKDLNWMFE